MGPSDPPTPPPSKAWLLTGGISQHFCCHLPMSSHSLSPGLSPPGWLCCAGISWERWHAGGQSLPTSQGGWFYPPFDIKLNLQGIKFVSPASERRLVCGDARPSCFGTKVGTEGGTGMGFGELSSDLGAGGCFLPHRGCEAGGVPTARPLCAPAAGSAAGEGTGREGEV